jgi:hypothetical protein
LAIFLYGEFSVCGSLELGYRLKRGAVLRDANLASRVQTPALLGSQKPGKQSEFRLLSTVFVEKK